LRTGGRAELFYEARDRDELAEAAAFAQSNGIPLTVVGGGSNVLPSDDGVPGLVLANRAAEIAVEPGGLVTADTGALFQRLFLKTAQASLTGFEYAVGIPGSVGGALASNAGAYRSCVSEFLTELEVVEGGVAAWVHPSTMGFAYRDSRLRRGDAGKCVVTRVRFQLEGRDPNAVYAEAREYQRQRISKQPPPASAGSFFKNALGHGLAERVPGLPEKLREAGVVPAGFLIEACGLKGARIGGAALAERHANFIVNVGRATATEVRALAELAKRRVAEQFGVDLEEEVLYLGDWSRWGT
jgi:UDP-N-acetylmuramate dehydrogenase